MIDHRDFVLHEAADAPREQRRRQTVPADIAYAKKKMIVGSHKDRAVIATENLMLFVVHGDIHTLIMQMIRQEASMDKPGEMPGIFVERGRYARSRT